MWTQPRATMRFLLQQTPHWYWWSPIFVVGSCGVFQVLSIQPQWQQNSLSERIMMAAMMGGIYGWIQVVIVAFLLGAIGRIWHVDAPPRALRLAVTWSQLPGLLSFVLWIVEFQTVGMITVGQAFTENHWPFLIARGLLSLYGALLLAMSVAEVQQISFKQSALSIALLFLGLMFLAALVIPGAAS